MNTTQTITISGGYLSEEWTDIQPTPVDQQFDSPAGWRAITTIPGTLVVEAFTGVVTGGVPPGDTVIAWDNARHDLFATYTVSFDKRPEVVADPGEAFRVDVVVTWGPVPPSWIDTSRTLEPELMPIELDLEDIARGYDKGWVGGKSAWEGGRIPLQKPLGDPDRTSQDNLIGALRRGEV